MSEKEEKYFHYDTTLGRVISEEKYTNHFKEEFIVPKDKKKTLVYENEMPFSYIPKKSIPTKIDYLSTQEELRDRCWYFADSFDRWSMETPLTIGSEEIFSKVFKEENKYAFFGLNFSSNRHFELNSTVFKNDDEYCNQYPNYHTAKLMFYYDKNDSNNRYKVIFIITTKISSIKHDDTDHFHTIVLKTNLLPMHSTVTYADFFYSMMCLIKGVNIYTSDTELEEILTDPINQ